VVAGRRPRLRHPGSERRTVLQPNRCASTPLWRAAREIGDPDQMHAGRATGLCKIHGAELGRDDHGNAQRHPGRLAFEQLAMEVHLPALPLKISSQFDADLQLAPTAIGRRPLLALTGGDRLLQGTSACWC